MTDVESIPFQELGEPERVLRVGDIVWDDLTMTKARVLRISISDGEHLPLIDDRGTVGIWIENDYVGGGRHPWEISLMKESMNA